MMGKPWRVPSPRIIMDPAGGWGARLFMVFLVFVLTALAFGMGFYLATEHARPLESLVESLSLDKRSLTDEVANLRADKAALERHQQIDRDALAAVQASLKAEQEARLAQEKDLSALKRLIRVGGGGILKIQDLALTPLGEEGMFAYRFTITQIMPDYAESVASAQIKVVGKRHAKQVEWGLDKLPGSKPLVQPLKFKHFQTVEGRLKLPADLEPEALLIEIDPISSKLIPATESFPWVDATRTVQE